MQLYDDIVAVVTKFSAFIGGVSAGLLSKISFELLMRRKLSMLQWFGIVGISVGIGYITSVFCYAKGMTTEASYIVPTSTLFAEKIVIYLTTHYKTIIEKIINPKK